MKQHHTWLRGWAVLAVLGLMACEGVPAEVDEPAGLESSSGEPAESALRSSHTTGASAFPGATIWVRQGVGPYDVERLDAVAQDRQGNTIAAGVFSGTIDFGAGRVWNGDPGDCFVVVVKYAPDARVLWNLPLRSWACEGLPVPFAEVSAVATDRRGNILVAGRTEGLFELGSITLPGGLFLLKLSAEGSLLWAQTVESTETDSRMNALATDHDNNILVGGTVLNTLRIGTADLSSPSIPGPWLAKLTPHGTVLWAKVLPRIAAGAGHGVTVDSEQSAYLCGNQGHSPFVSRFSPEGQLLWTRYLTGAGGTARGVATHGNRVIATGSFSGTFSFKGQTFTSSGQDAWLAAYTRDGEPRWARNFGLSGAAVGMDQNDGVLVTGTYQDLDTVGLEPLRGSETGSNMFVARFNRLNGQPLWARGFGDLGSSASVSPTDLAVTRGGEGAIVGHFSLGPINFGGAVLAPTGYTLRQDPFILRVAP